MNNKPEIIRALDSQKLDSLFSNQLWKLIGSVTVPFLVYFMLTVDFWLKIRSRNGLRNWLECWLIMDVWRSNYE